MGDNPHYSPMANNNLPSSISELLDLATHNIAGIQSKGSAIGLLQYTAANFSPVVTVLTVKQSAFNDARSAYFLAYAPVLAWIPEARAFGMLARKLLGVSLGEDWSPAWVAWGWVDQTTVVPTDLAGLKALLGAIKGRLLADPSYEVSSPKIDFTALRVDALFGTLSPAESGLTGADVALGDAREDRGEAEKSMRKAMRGLIKILGELLDPNSPDWDAFGLNRPGASTVPAIPTQPTLSAAGAGKVSAQVVAVPLATYYRWKYRVLPLDTAWRFWGRTADPMALLEGLPAVGTLEVTCEAANPAGPSKPSAKAVLGIS